MPSHVTVLNPFVPPDRITADVIADADVGAAVQAVWGRCPEHPPYGGAFADAIPHLTIGSTPLGDLAALRQAEVEVRSALPFSTSVDQVVLVAGSAGASPWRTVAEWSLPLNAEPTSKPDP